MYHEDAALPTDELFRINSFLDLFAGEFDPVQNFQVLPKRPRIEGRYAFLGHQEGVSVMGDSEEEKAFFAFAFGPDLLQFRAVLALVSKIGGFFQ